MKARINKDDILIVRAETDLETHALRDWVKKNPFCGMKLLVLPCQPLSGINREEIELVFSDFKKACQEVATSLEDVIVKLEKLMVK